MSPKNLVTTSRAPDTRGELQLAAVYARKSNANESAVLGQFETCRQRARRDGWHVPESADFLFGDDATSGKTTYRKELMRLVDLIRSGSASFNRVYIRHRDRLSRAADLDFRAWFEFECRQRDVQVCYASDDEHRDVRSGKKADMGLHIVESMDDYTAHSELKTIKERLVGATREHVIKKFFVGAVAPYGTERWLATYDEARTPVMRAPERGGIRLADHAVLLRWRESEIPTVRFIFDALEGKTSLRTLAHELNRRGDPCSAGVAKWSADIVSRIARNRLYMGDFHFKRTSTHVDETVDASKAEHLSDVGIYVRDYISDPPISKQQFDVVQKLLEENRERHERRMASSPEYPLTGVLRCSACHVRLNGTTHPGGKRTAPYRQYRHPPRDRCGSECPFVNRTTRADVLDERVIDAVRKILVEGRLVEETRRALQHLRGDEHAEERTRAIGAIRAQMVTLRSEIDVANKRSVEQEAAGDFELAKLSIRIAREKIDLRKKSERRLAELEAEDARLGKIERTLPGLEHDSEALGKMFQTGAVDRKAVIGNVMSAITMDFDTFRATLVMRTSFTNRAVPHRCA